MQLKELRELANQAGRKIKVKTINFEDLARDSYSHISIVPAFPSLFCGDKDRNDYINSLSAAEKELFFVDLRKIEKKLNK